MKLSCFCYSRPRENGCLATVNGYLTLAHRSEMSLPAAEIATRRRPGVTAAC